MLLLLLSHFSRVRLCATPYMAAHQAPRPRDSPDKNTGVGCHFIIQSPKPSVQFSSVAQSCLTLCDPMNRSTPGLPVHHQLPEFTQTHAHLVGDAIQPSHPLLSPSPPAPNPSQHQGLFQRVSSSHEVAKVLEFQLQHQSPSEHPGLISFRMDWLDLRAFQGTFKSLKHHSLKTPIFLCSASQSNSHIHT